MVSPQKRPFKIWSKARSFDPNLTRFNSFVTSSSVPVFVDYFFLNNFMGPRLVRRTIVRSAAYAYLSREAIEAFRKVVSPHFRKRSKGRSRFHIRCYAHLPLMKKPAEVRMGGGKGSKLRTFVCPVRPGQILFEISFRPGPWSKHILHRASRKLNFPVTVSYV
jgi:large subunit ribosomal protein L16